MKMVAEYIERALQFEKMAANESDVQLKASFERQAEAYRKLAAERAARVDRSPVNMAAVNPPKGGG